MLMLTANFFHQEIITNCVGNSDFVLTKDGTLHHFIYFSKAQSLTLLLYPITYSPNSCCHNLLHNLLVFVSASNSLNEASYGHNKVGYKRSGNYCANEENKNYVNTRPWVGSRLYEVATVREVVPPELNVMTKFMHTNKN